MASDGLSDGDIVDILERVHTFAVIGASAKPERPSYGVMAFLQARGYAVRPVNPGQAGHPILGEPVWARLADVPGPVDVVDVFRESRAAGDAVREAIAEKDRLGISVVWMQLGVINEEAAELARAAGLKVVMDRCPKIEVARLF